MTHLLLENRKLLAGSSLHDHTMHIAQLKATQRNSHNQIQLQLQLKATRPTQSKQNELTQLNTAHAACQSVPMSLDVLAHIRQSLK